MQYQCRHEQNWKIKEGENLVKIETEIVAKSSQNLQFGNTTLMMSFPCGTYCKPDVETFEKQIYSTLRLHSRQKYLFAGQRLPTQFGRKTTIKNQIHRESRGGSVLKGNNKTQKDINLSFVTHWIPAISVKLKRSFTHKMAFNSKSTPTSPNF